MRNIIKLMLVVTIDMNSGSEVYELEIPYRNFTKNVTTSGKRIK